MQSTFAVVTMACVAAIGVAVGRLAADEDGRPAASAPASDQGRPLFAQGSTSELPARDSTPPTDVDLARLRLREGTRLNNVAGRFRKNGESLTFIDSENREIGGLPNLNLERIIRMLKTVEEPESIIWSVSGTVTEFSGRNYLLITRAVYKAAAPPPAPESIEQNAAPSLTK